MPRRYRLDASAALIRSAPISPSNICQTGRMASRHCWRCAGVSSMISLVLASTIFCLAYWFSASACLFTSTVTSAMICSRVLRTSAGRPFQNFALVITM